MKQLNLARVMGSPVLFFFLLAAMFGISAVWYRSENTAKLPPHVVGFDWSQHPDALLISYPPEECGCGPSASERVSEALQQGRDVLVIASELSPELKALRTKPFPSSRFLLVSNVSEGVIRRFSPSNEAVEIQVRKGQIVHNGENAL